MRYTYNICWLLFLFVPYFTFASNEESIRNRAPIELTAEVLNSTTVKLGWMGTKNDVSYKLRVRPDGVLTWTYYQIEAPSSTRRISDLIPGTLYHWQVQTRFSKRLRDTSDYVSGRSFTAWEPCETPQAPVAYVSDPTRVWLSWNSSDDQAQYIVKLRARGEKTWLKYETSHRNIWIDGLQPGLTYDWIVTAQCQYSGMISENSDMVQFSTVQTTEQLLDANAPGAANRFPERLISFNGDASCSFPLEGKILDPMGQHLKVLPVYYTSSNGTVMFDIIGDLPPGLYNVSYRCGCEMQTKNVVIASSDF